MPKSPDITFEPLTEGTLPAAIDVAERSFAHVPGADKPRFWFNAGLHADQRGKLEELAGVKLAPLLQYWVAKLRGAVVGTTGLYSLTDDYPEAAWVGWFCLDDKPDVRGHGYGTKLVDFTIEQAHAAGARQLKLYTSDMPQEAAAQRVYEKAGLVVVGDEPHPVYGQYKLLYRQLALSRE